VETILLLAAERFELSGMLSLLFQPRRLPWPLPFAGEAELRGRRWLMVAGGPGPHLAVAAAECAARRVAIDRVVSTGFCGGLDPALQVGDIFVASRVIGLDREVEFPAYTPSSSRRHTVGTLASVDRVVGSAREKRSLRESGAAAVEMEAAGLAAWAAGTDRPFYCVRAVTDQAEEDFVIDLNSARDANGRFRRVAILRSALLQPFRGIPELVGWMRRGRMCARALGDFLGDCEF
jgi:adenosylhomocysteine nucleosidase